MKPRHDPARISHHPTFQKPRRDGLSQSIWLYMKPTGGKRNGSRTDTAADQPGACAGQHRTLPRQDGCNRCRELLIQQRSRQRGRSQQRWSGQRDDEPAPRHAASGVQRGDRRPGREAVRQQRRAPSALHPKKTRDVSARGICTERLRHIAQTGLAHPGRSRYALQHRQQ